MEAPTAKAVFEGKVQGVVVQAIIFTSLQEKPSKLLFSKIDADFSFFTKLNCAIAVVSFTSL